MRSSMNNINQIKIVVVGDGNVGKTCILQSYKNGCFPTEHIPTIEDNFTKELGNCTLHLWDTAGQENYDKVREKSYSNTDVFLMVFDVTNHGSFENALEKWLPEVQNSVKYDKQPIFILVGNKIDLRKEDNGRNLQTDVVSRKVKEMKIQIEYLECSALKQIGLDDIFKRAVELKSQNDNSKKQQKVEINEKNNEVNQNYCCQIS